MNEQDVIRSMTNADDIVQVTLDDKICVGCNHCGNCCINTQVRLTAYDLYQIVTTIPNPAIKEAYLKEIDKELY